MIGRAPSAGLMLASHEVSRAHCRIAAVGDEVSIADLESTNGTFVDGKRITGTAAWPPGVIVGVGPFRLLWEQAEDVEGTMPGSSRGPARRRGTKGTKAETP